MEFTKGFVYTLTDFEEVRLLEMGQEYHSFEPDEPGQKYVRLVKISGTQKTPFRMNVELFKEKVVETHGYST